MPGQGSSVKRDYTAAEREVAGSTPWAFWAMPCGRRSPERQRTVEQRSRTAVWNYKLGGYQVLKKWLSYRESKVLGRNLLAGGGAALLRHGAADR